MMSLVSETMESVWCAHELRQSPWCKGLDSYQQMDIWFMALIGASGGRFALQETKRNQYSGFRQVQERQMTCLRWKLE